jgi:hypothetical protein
VSDFALNAIKTTLEVDDAIQALVAAALVASGHTTLVVATRRLFQRFGQRLLRTLLGEIGVSLITVICRRAGLVGLKDFIAIIQV